MRSVRREEVADRPRSRGATLMGATQGVTSGGGDGTDGDDVARWALG